MVDSFLFSFSLLLCGKFGDRTVVLRSAKRVKTGGGAYRLLVVVDRRLAIGGLLIVNGKATAS